MSRRTERINDLLREGISDLLLREVQDPRMSVLVTFTAVGFPPDLRRAKVFVSVLGTDEEKDSTFRGLEAAAHFLQRKLGKRLTLRRVPQLTFLLDDSLEQGAHLLKLLAEARGDAPP